MSVLDIRRWPDPILSRACDEVGEITDDIRFLAADMIETMYAAQGRGLAAPQVGRALRLFVMDAAWKDGPARPVVMVNPVIELSDIVETVIEESCLSLPGVSVALRRPMAVELSWTDLAGKRREMGIGGADARIALHEIDHLDGIMSIDRLGPEERAEKLKEYLA